MDDNALLGEYVKSRSEEAFAALVVRHVNKVHSVAWRHTQSPHQAQEITQQVFATLARQAPHLGKGVILSGWLYTTARLTALTLIRGEIRRTRREQEAYMQSLPDQNETEAWAQIAPLLDAAMEKLSEGDRSALVLRFFDGRSMSEVGAALGASEDAAKQRVGRAVEKLRRLLGKTGVALPAALLGAALASNSVMAAPPTLAKTVTAFALAKGATTGSSGLLASAKGGVFTALLAPLAVLLPNYLAYRIGLAEAQSEDERLWIKECYRKTSMAVLAMLAPIAALVFMVSRFERDPRLLSGLFATGLVLVFLPAFLFFCVSGGRRLRSARMGVLAAEYGGAFPSPAWEYESPLRILGLPLIHIRIGDPFAVLKQPVKAWFAAGEVAFGGLFAFGSVAIAPISIGGLSLGLLSFGGLSVGGFALGGIALGVWPLFGGLTAGWQAFGGGVAIGWNSAAGGVALARDFAIGGIAHAAQSNNTAARAFIEPNVFYRISSFLNTHWLWINLLWMIPFAIKWRLIIRQARLKTRSQRIPT